MAGPKKLKIRKGDRVVVIAGKDRGREGTASACSSRA
jgi:ribosomal protein L24